MALPPPPPEEPSLQAGRVTAQDPVPLAGCLALLRSRIGEERIPLAADGSFRPKQRHPLRNLELRLIRDTQWTATVRFRPDIDDPKAWQASVVVGPTYQLVGASWPASTKTLKGRILENCTGDPSVAKIEVANSVRVVGRNESELTPWPWVEVQAPQDIGLQYLHQHSARNPDARVVLELWDTESNERWRLDAKGNCGALVATAQAGSHSRADCEVVMLGEKGGRAQLVVERKVIEAGSGVPRWSTTRIYQGSLGVPRMLRGLVPGEYRMTAVLERGLSASVVCQVSNAALTKVEVNAQALIPTKAVRVEWSESEKRQHASDAPYGQLIFSADMPQIFAPVASCVSSRDAGKLQIYFPWAPRDGSHMLLRSGVGVSMLTPQRFDFSGDVIEARAAVLGANDGGRIQLQCIDARSSVAVKQGVVILRGPHAGYRLPVDLKRGLNWPAGIQVPWVAWCEGYRPAEGVFTTSKEEQRLTVELSAGSGALLHFRLLPPEGTGDDRFRHYRMPEALFGWQASIAGAPWVKTGCVVDVEGRAQTLDENGSILLSSDETISSFDLQAPGYMIVSVNPVVWSSPGEYIVWCKDLE